MSAITRSPINTSLLQQTKFQLFFTRLPHVTYFCQQVNLPGLTLTEVPRPTPFIDLYVPGEKLIYDTLNINFLVDEEMRAWFEIHDWIRGLTFPTNFQEYRNVISEKVPFGKIYSDCILTLNNNANKTVITVKLVDCFPTTLSGIDFDSTSVPDSIVTASASFRFSYFNITRP